MPHNHSACIPPPSDYTPRTRPPQSAKIRERGGKGGGRNYSGNRRQVQPTTFQSAQTEPETICHIQPKDKFHHNEDDDYFARVQDEEEEELKVKEDTVKEGEESDEDDPLDAYMKSLEGNEGTKTKPRTKEPSVVDELLKPETSVTTAQESDKRGIRLDIDETDDIEASYYQYVEQTRSRKGGDNESDDSQDKQNMVEYDLDGNILSVRRLKKEIDPLPVIDHSTITYEPYEKVFYREHPEIAKLTQEQGEELRSKLDIKVSGSASPKPVCSFAHFRFDEQLMKVIRKSEYTQPTPIQAQAIPAALMGRNILGIATTGSGKTAAYIWPMIVHIMGQPDLKRGDGPIALILVPTRELALQVYSEAKKFSSSYKIAVVCAYGGGSKYEQSRDLESGAEIVVATPGRLIDLIKMGVTNLKRVTYLVLDEADRFFDMGFELQVRSICDHIRPDRQTLLFSATFKKKIEQLARTVTDDPIKIVQKTLGEVNEDVKQHVVVTQVGPKKWDWLLSKLVEFTSAGSVLIFVTRISNAEELHKNMKDQGKEVLLLHGDMEQSERNRVITAFKRKEKDIMIATDVAARGLDISHIRTVINYDVARDIDTHTHRVGRTGRAGTKGDAYTLITEKDKDFAGHLVKSLESCNQKVGDDLMKIAMQSHNFRKMRSSKKRDSGHSSSSRHHHRPHHNGEGYNRHHQYHHHHHQDSSNRHSNHSRSYPSRDEREHSRNSYRGETSSRDSSVRSHQDQSWHRNEGKRPRWQ